MKPPDFFPTAFHQHLRGLVAGFSEAAFTTLNLPAALAPLVRAANDVFGAGSTAIWLYDRRARELVIGARSDEARDSALSETADAGTWAARGLRLDRAQIFTDAGGARALVAPLRGSRRALGTLVMEGGTVERADGDYVEAVDGFVRQLAAAIENVHLLEEVLRQRRLLEDTFNSLSELVVVTDDALRVVQTNIAFALRVGMTAASLIDRPLMDLIGRDMAAWVQSPASLEATRGGTGAAHAPRFEDERLRGTFTVTVSPLINREGDPVGRVLVARDITEQIRLEAEQAALRDRLAQTEKLASLGQFVAGIAHEMNNPLQGVLGHLELLLSTSDAARPVRRELRVIYTEGERAAKIVENLLAFTGAQRMARKRLQLDTIMSRALASRRVACRRARIGVARTRGDNIPDVMGDALRLYQAILNVLINAEHAVKDSPPNARRIDVHTGVTASGAVALTIHDTGGGIPPEVLPQIFNPFFTTRDVGEGSGLGLTISYGIIQEHGGTIRAANAPEGGACFTIELPSAPAE